jgi:Tfp pilus assembly protein PilO
MKTNTVYIFIASLVLLLGSIGISIFVAKQIREKAEAVKVQYAEDFKNKNIDLGIGLKREWSTLIEQEKIITSAFLNENEIVPFITQLESSANTLGLKITVDKVDRGAEESIGQTYKTKSITFNVSIDGSFEQIKYFIDQIMISKKVVTVPEFKIYKTGNSDMYNARIIITSNTLAL